MFAQNRLLSANWDFVYDGDICGCRQGKGGGGAINPHFNINKLRLFTLSNRSQVCDRSHEKHEKVHVCTLNVLYRPMWPIQIQDACLCRFLLVVGVGVSNQTLQFWSSVVSTLYDVKTFCCRSAARPNECRTEGARALCEVK